MAVLGKGFLAGTLLSKPWLGSHEEKPENNNILGKDCRKCVKSNNQSENGTESQKNFRTQIEQFELI
jgi:hypothetical protein